MVSVKSIKQGKSFLGSFTRPPAWPKQISQHALDMAQKLSHQLRAAEDRIAELEAEVGMYRDKADRAEQWLHRVYTEIEDRFLREAGGVRGSPQRRQGAQRSLSGFKPPHLYRNLSLIRDTSFGGRRA